MHIFSVNKIGTYIVLMYYLCMHILYLQSLPVESMVNQHGSHFFIQGCRWFINLPTYCIARPQTSECRST